MNCHFVTRWITEEWEYAPGSLFYFDFEDQLVKRQFSKYLFAEEDTNSREIETLLNKFVETPLKKFKSELVAGSELEVTDWNLYRSLFLYFMIQSARYSKAQTSSEAQKSEEHNLDLMLNRGEDFLNQLVKADMNTNQIVVVRMPAGQVLFFPEVGFFQVPVKDSGCITNYTFGLVLPLTPFLAIARVSKSTDLKYLFESREQFSAFSLGLNTIAKRVLIPKIVRDQHDDQSISNTMTAQRQAAINIAAGIHQIRKLVVDMYRAAGLEVGPFESE